MAFSLNKLFSSLKTAKAPSTNGLTSVGIDIGSSSVKIVEVIDENEKLRLGTYGELQLGPYADAPLGSNVALPVDKRTEAIVDVLREANSKASTAVLTLQLSQSFVTSLFLKAQAKENISPRVPVEARKVIPVPLSDVALEWVDVPPFKNTSEGTREVLVAAIQKNALDETKEIITSLQKSQVAPEAEVFSAMRGIAKEEDEVLAIIDFGAKNNKLYIVEAGYLRRIHRVQAGGVLATERIADLLQVSFDEAENIKRNFEPHTAQAADIKKAVLSTYERSMQEFKRAMDQYELRSGSPITRIVVTGGAVLFPEFGAYVNYTLEKPTEIANAFDKVSYPAFMEDTIKEISPTFTVALGAALRSFE